MCSVQEEGNVLESITDFSKDRSKENIKYSEKCKVWKVTLQLSLLSFITENGIYTIALFQLFPYRVQFNLRRLHELLAHSLPQFPFNVDIISFE